jgi:hypothetical protein
MVATGGAGTYSLNEPMGSCWLLRLDASGSSVQLSAAVGQGSMQPIETIDPAQTLVYADDLFQWSSAFSLGRVGMSPWGAPSGWSDSNAMWLGPVTNAQASAPIGEWVLKKWVWFSSTDTYTFSLCGDDKANLYVDGQPTIVGAKKEYSTNAKAQVPSGWHLVSISCVNTGSTPKQTGVLFSVTDSSGNVIDNGSYHPAIGQTWLTSGFINPAMRYSWYVIPASQITSEEVELQVSTNGSPKVNGVFWYSVAPWRWDEGGQYDASPAGSTPSQNPPNQSLASGSLVIYTVYSLSGSIDAISTVLGVGRIVLRDSGSINSASSVISSGSSLKILINVSGSIDATSDVVEDTVVNASGSIDATSNVIDVSETLITGQTLAITGLDWYN